MKKDFDTWNKKKKQIHSDDAYLPLYHERQIRWCRLGTNVGFEQDGSGNGFSRPVLILKGFSRHVCLVVPLTTSKKKNPYHFAVGVVDGRDATAIISQIRLVDTKRLYKHIGTLDKEMFEHIRKIIKDML
jgi:mRNA interferase MazF